MNVSLCDACGKEISDWLQSESFHHKRYDSLRVCSRCVGRFFVAVGECCDAIRSESNVTPEMMPKQNDLFGRWLQVRPLKVFTGMFGQ